MKGWGKKVGDEEMICVAPQQRNVVSVSFPYLRARARVVSRMNGTDIRMSCSPQPLIAIPC